MYPLRGYILGVLTHTTALDRLGEVMELWPCGFKIAYTHLGFASVEAVWLGIWNSDYVVLKSSIRNSASPRSAVVWPALWNSDHVVLKFIIRTSALPRQQRSYWGLRVTKDAYFSLLTHTKQLSLVTFSDMIAGIEVNFGQMEPEPRTEPRMDRQTWKSK